MATQANVFDTAEFILQNIGPTSTMKIQKLVYYAQAWSLAWDDDVLFDEEVEAWANGPVVRELFEAHKGQYQVNPGDFGGDPNKLEEKQQGTIRSVLEFYGDKSSQWLSDLTHSEDPWVNARAGVPDGERSNSLISKESILEYYSSL